jgi:hypothetical protein
MKLISIVVVLAAIVLVFAYRGRKPGYRGAVGFKNRGNTEIERVTLTGFSEPITTRTIMPKEHSFNYVGPQQIPADVSITWRLVGDTADRAARVVLDGVPKDAKDGELFFVLSDTAAWTVEYAPTLRLDALQRGG